MDILGLSMPIQLPHNIGRCRFCGEFHSWKRGLTRATDPRIHSGWMVGLTKETDERIRLAAEKKSITQNGRKHTENSKKLRQIAMLIKWQDKKFREFMSEIHNSEGFKNKSKIEYTPAVRKNISLAHIGIKHSIEWNLHSSLSKIGDKNPAWCGGISFIKYPKSFDYKLKEFIRDRDGRICKFCGKSELDNKKKLSVHHIDYNKHNINVKNLISLCIPCHQKTEFNRKFWINKCIEIMVNVC